MSLKVYVDTNVFLDSILNRDNGIAREVLYFLEDKNFEIILNDVSIINIHYFSSKDKKLNSETVKKYIGLFLEEYTIISANTELLKSALYSKFSDFEDGVQYFCAKEIGADLIISKDKKGFKESDIEKINPVDFYNEYIKK
jgi:predicted nucleic acid-binding protein